MALRWIGLAALAAMALAAALLGMLAMACAGSEPWEDPCIAERAKVMTDEMENERPTDEYMRAVQARNKELFYRFPHVRGFGSGDFRDELGYRIGGYGITVRVLELTDQSTLPVEDRIPECLEGVPVRIIKVGPNELLGGNRR